MRALIASLIMSLPLAAHSAVVSGDISTAPGVVTQVLPPAGMPSVPLRTPIFQGSFAQGDVAASGSLFALAGSILTTVSVRDSLLFYFDNPINALTLTGGVVEYDPNFIDATIELSTADGSVFFTPKAGAATTFGIISDSGFTEATLRLIDYDTTYSVAYLGLTAAYAAPVAPAPTVPLPAGMVLLMSGGAALAGARRLKS